MTFDLDLHTAETAVPTFLDELARWVNCDSGTQDKAGVDRVGAMVQARFNQIGFTTEVIPQTDYGNHVVARRAGQGQARLMLIGHMDTVYQPGEAALRPFTLRDGRAYGPGIFDMKGGILLGMTALDLLGPVVLDRFGMITFLCNSDEEVGSPSSKPIVRDLAAQADAVLVLEPNRELRNITVGRKGVAPFTLTVTGLSAHAGVAPDSGRNAILEMAHLIIALQGLHKQRPSLSLNVGAVRGGANRNVVPDHCEVLFEMRAANLPTFEAGLADIQQVLAQPRHVPGTTVTLTQGPTHLPLEPSASSRHLREIALAAGEASGFTPQFISIGGASDGNTTGGMGIPTLDGLGVIGEHSHNPNECISVDQIAPRLRFLAGIIGRIGQEPT